MAAFARNTGRPVNVRLSFLALVVMEIRPELDTPI